MNSPVGSGGMQAGVLAKRAGITVRTLHHYDEIGLLQPSSRTDAGYRLYTSADIIRLQRIQLLKNLGLTLTEIKDLLNGGNNYSIKALVVDNLAAVNQRITTGIDLREKLWRMQELLEQNEEPDTETFLETLELICAYERYFTRDELKKLRFYTRQRATKIRWRQLLEELRVLREKGIPPTDPKSWDLAVRWMEQLEQDTDGNPELLRKITVMAEREEALQTYLGVDNEQITFIQQAFLNHKQAIFKQHLRPSVYSYLADRYPRQMKRWPFLLARIHQMLEEGIPPESEEGLSAAREWESIFVGYAGSDPETQAEIRQVQMSEPELCRGTWLKNETLTFLQKALKALNEEGTN
ncbi:MerR family transcriptional regulator [Idiomarina sp. M1R2S28]|uniref:MerR family transcriptional regulator n=1 Tax=Idiomarina rhizosphaerae TaxID=2961572 RepID=A0A9X2G462_9GAMM|nr:MerR family transcriptional regulator [Idiomarina rhizosphaerae]MCP1339588.1 MerR family transcriptional regulator [Idiomarina rhizosphaerae]